MTFSTPFTCTETIAPVKTLKYFALASKISDGAEDKTPSSFFERKWSECLKAGINMAAHNTVLFLYV